MDTKDPVWDDDDSSISSDGFRPRAQPPAPEVPASQLSSDNAPEPVAETGAYHVPHENEPEQADDLSLEQEPQTSTPEVAEPTPEPVPIPVPGAGRVRVDPIDSFRRAETGGARAARDRRQRSSASMIIIALILFLISVISVSVYFFSRPAESGAQGGETEQVEFIDQGKQSPADTSQQPPAAQQETPEPAPEQSSAEQTPPPPPPGVALKASTAPSGTTAASGRAAREQPTRTAVPAPDLAESRVRRAEPEPSPKATPEPAPKPSPKAKPEPAPKAPSKESVREQASLRNAAPAPRASLKTTKSASSVGAQWVIQVHSSASVDDADEWLRQLQSRNVGDGRIEPVTQQGKVWYRVRFGRYATREEAEQAALQLGYRNAWIDRVR